MVTEIKLKPACISELFFNDLSMIPNKVYFEFSQQLQQFEGPYLTPEKPDDFVKNEFFDKFFLSKPMLFLPSHDDLQINTLFTVKMRIAKPDDFKTWDTEALKEVLRINFSFYLTDKGQFIGPFTIMRSTHPNDLKKYLEENRAYVIDCACEQRALRETKKVS